MTIPLSQIEPHLVEPAKPPAKTEEAPVTARPNEYAERKGRALLYAAKWGQCAEGKRNPAAYHHAADLLRDFDLPEADAWEIIRQWNDGNTPPLDEWELRQTFHDGLKYGKHEAGCKLKQRKAGKRQSNREERRGETIPIGRAVPFPVGCLPSPVDGFVSDAARAIGCDPSYVALPLLAGLAAAIGNTRRIRLKHSWCEPAIVWGAIVGDSGTLKSPALEMALRPIRRRQQAAMQEHAKAIELYEVQRMQHDKELAEWKRSKTGGQPPMKPEEPQADRCWCNDITIEALAVVLQQNPRGLLLKRDELAGWLGSFDRYAQGKGSDAAMWLEMFGGRSIMVERKGGQAKTFYVPRAAVSVTGGIQPETLHRALGVEYRENGLAARLLLACPSRQVKRWTEDDISHEIESRMEDLFDRLYSLQLVEDAKGDAGPLDLPLTPEAKDTWIAFYDEHAREQEELTGDLAAAWSKLEGYAARLGLIVHLVRWAAQDRTLDDPNMVDERSIEGGVRLSRWFGQEADRVYAILRESEEDRDRRRLIEAIERKGGAVTVRDLLRSTRMFASAEAGEQALEELCQAGYGRWEDLPIGPTGGRPTRRFVLDPGIDVDETLDSDAVSGVVSASTGSAGTDNSEEKEERAAILEYDAELPRQVAEERAFGSEEGA
jgi:hypothetical protein